MKLNDVKVNSDSHRTGRLDSTTFPNALDCGYGFAVKATRNGASCNPSCSRRCRARNVINRLDYDEGERITNWLLLNTCLIDWDGLQDDDGNAIPYSKEMAEKLLTDPDFRKFRDAVMTASSPWLAKTIEEDIKDASGNLVALSPGATSGERKQKLARQDRSRSRSACSVL